VAQVSPVQEVVNPNSKIDEEGELRTDLINLLERSQEHLTSKQSSEVKRLLKEFQTSVVYTEAGRSIFLSHQDDRR
jgi:NCAIR mutase (PurE)-related protein